MAFSIFPRSRALHRHGLSLSLSPLGRYTMTPQQGEAITSILQERCGQWTLVQLRDGQQFRVFDIAWGRDVAAGADFDHITTNISPGPDGEHAIDFFHTSDVVAVTDPSTGQSLLPTSAA